MLPMSERIHEFASAEAVRCLIESGAGRIDRATIDLLLEDYQVDYLPRQSFIARHGEKVQRLILSAYGTCSWSLSNEDGLESIVSFCHSGTWAGITELVDDYPWRADFCAESEVVAISWTHEIISGKLGSNAPFWRFLAGRTINHLAIQFSLTLADRRPLHEKLALLLGLLVDRRAQEIYGSGGQANLSVPLTQERLAAALRCSRQSINQVLADMRKAGIVSTGREHVAILDPVRLMVWGGVSKAGTRNR